MKYEGTIERMVCGMWMAEEQRSTMKTEDIDFVWRQVALSRQMAQKFGMTYKKQYSHTSERPSLVL